jgi:AcrR family transcriptional regulator
VARPKIHDEGLRRTLLDRAAGLVFDAGVAALSLRRLAAAADTSTTAVYSLFGNKAGLLDSLYQEAARRFGARLAAVEPTDDPVDDIVSLGIAYRDYALSEPHLYTIMFARREDDDGEKKGEAAKTIEPLLAAVLRGQAAGLLADGPPERIALACWGVAHGLVSIELTGRVPLELNVAAGYEQALRAMVTGWVTRTGDDRPS